MSFQINTLVYIEFSVLLGDQTAITPAPPQTVQTVPSSFHCDPHHIGLKHLRTLPVVLNHPGLVISSPMVSPPN